MDMNSRSSSYPSRTSTGPSSSTNRWGGGRTPTSSPTRPSIVQLTLPGSAGSIQFGVGLTPAPPGSLRGAVPRRRRHRGRPCRARGARRPGKRDLPRGPAGSAVPARRRTRTGTGPGHRPVDLRIVPCRSCRRSRLACPAETEGNHRAGEPVLLDVMQRFPMFSEAVFPTLRDLDARTAPRQPGEGGDRGVVLPVLLGRSGRPGGLRARPRTALHVARAFSVPTSSTWTSS